ncbi:MAG: DEAD/DEAH box helicase family protein [Actinomycetota bacterium]|nr:DEAD/DEAH box helicase family protein [Actinomycetota bacterium]
MARATRQPQLPFERKLVVNEWMLSLFGVSCFEELAEHLRDERLEGLDGDNIHLFHHELALRIPAEQRPELPDEVLLDYDQNIVRHTQRLSERRIARGDDAITWKYFQYLALLFTEVYLDRYFRDPAALLAALDAQVASHNDRVTAADDRVGPFDLTADAAPQLNKIAFWMATGSGKTLLMHVNTLQYRHWLERHGRASDLNRVILLTPNEGLSKQHLGEFETSGIQAELFTKDGRSLFAGKSVEIIDIHKLKEDMGDKTVAVDAFEGNNLVLIDEGHRGASGGEEGAWMRFRNALCEQGFSFEYSATFSQAVKGSAKLTDTYAKSILVDYSYRYFYGDGFGKDYHIANLEDDADREWMDSYLTACLLSFYQQLRLYGHHADEFRPFNLEKPLWVFVGGSVNAVRSESRRQVSDVVEILEFLVRYLGDRRASVERIRRILTGGLVTRGGKNLFAGRFKHLDVEGVTPEQAVDEVLGLVFNAPGGGTLHMENLKGADGEIALKVGENESFGVINVGDDAKLTKLCVERGLDAIDRDFAGSLFHSINKPESTITMLIGSKKFTEGWNSWRVSTMGLMNVGRGEGAQIIQLFGRGVRLKGYGRSLKRSSRAMLPPGVRPPVHIEALETLGIFGVRADYMAQFRDFLEKEGLPADDRVEVIIPIVRTVPSRDLPTIRLKDRIGGVVAGFGDAFRCLGPVPTLAPPDPVARPGTEWLQDNKVVVNWYPKIQAMGSVAAPDEDGWQPEEAFFTHEHVAMLDSDALHFELERFKAERGWYNLNLPLGAVRNLLADTTWYRLQIPSAQMTLDSMDKVRLWQEIAGVLLKRYVERFYTFHKHAWELPHLEYQPLGEDDRNYPRVSEDPPVDGYRVVIDSTETETIARIEGLRDAIERGDYRPWEYRGFKAIWCEDHLYRPLLFAEGSGSVEVTPAPLNKGERRFVDDLSAFVAADRAKGSGGVLHGKDLYLLRNQSRGRGVGFFEAGNFHPDFILWLIDGEQQHVVFVDPKGVRNVPVSDPKVRFHESVKRIEERLGDPDISLHSFIVSNTPAYVVERMWGMKRADIEAKGVVFQEDDGYVGAIVSCYRSAC